MGHGNGDKFINKNYFDKLQNLNNLCVLMGCGSIWMTAFEYQAYLNNELKGTAMDYLSSDV